MTNRTEWRRSEIKARIDEVLDAAKTQGTQILNDFDGSFEVTFVPAKQSIEELFSKPGLISGDDISQ